MSTPSTRLYLRVNKTRADGCAPVYLRVIHARRSHVVSSGVWVEPKHWNPEKQRLRATHPMAKPFNAKLEDLLHKAQGAAMHAHTAEAVVAVLDGAGGLADFFDGMLADLDGAGAYWEAKKYRTLRGKLEAALGKPLAWGMLSRSGLVRFERHLRAPKPGGCGNGPNTVRKELARLRHVIQLALRAGALRLDADPFLAYDMPKGRKVVRRRLSADELAKLSGLELPFGSRLRTVRDAFLVAYYGSGVRISDVLRLTPESVVTTDDGARLVYRMQKTEKPVAPKLPRAALAVLGPYLEAGRAGRYLFPLLKPGDDADPIDLRRRQQAATSKANKALGRLGDLAEIGGAGLSTHVARHSFADAARKSGDLYAVSKALGHGNLSTTQAYLADFDTDAVDGLTDSLWNE